MSRAVGVRSLAVSFPGIVRTNDYWRQRYPEIVRDAGRRTLSRVFSPIDPNAATAAFDQEMEPFLPDPFRGTVERRYLGPGESALTLELRAAQDALAAATLRPEQVDLVLACSYLPDQLGPGNAAYLVRELGLRCPGWNIESTCNSTLVALQTAASLVRAGEYRNVLVTISCCYSRLADERDTLSWFLGDGAGACIVGAQPEGRGILGTKIIPTSETCGAFYIELARDEDGSPRLRMGAGRHASRMLRDTAADYLTTCARGAAEAAGVRLDEISFVVVNTPTAWHSRFAARVLGIAPERTITTYPRYANIGPVLTLANLYHAAHEARIGPDDLVLLYAVGSVSTTGAIVMRWGDVALGPPPPDSSTLVRQ